ncbi:hypothetical protein [Priestia aryabhattai]
MSLTIKMPRVNDSETVMSVSYQDGRINGGIKWHKNTKGNWELTHKNVVSKDLEKNVKKLMEQRIEGKFFPYRQQLAINGFFND